MIRYSYSELPQIINKGQNGINKGIAVVARLQTAWKYGGGTAATTEIPQNDSTISSAEIHLRLTDTDGKIVPYDTTGFGNEFAMMNFYNGQLNHSQTLTLSVSGLHSLAYRRVRL